MTITPMDGNAPRRIVTAACTVGALTGFAANSLLTRAAVAPGLIDAVTFTSLRLLAGALALGALLLLKTRSRAPSPTTQTPRWAGARPWQLPRRCVGQPKIWRHAPSCWWAMP